MAANELRGVSQNIIRKTTRKAKLSIWLIVPMLLMALIQLSTFFVILSASGEFDNIEAFAYSTLEEKNENRRTYIETALQNKAPYVLEYAVRFEEMITDILAQNEATIADIQKDQELNRQILSEAVPLIEGLLRRATANDAYLILETGNLYSDSGSVDAKAALYLRDLDTKTDAGYEDLLLEYGLSSISREYNLTLDSGWSLYFTPGPYDGETNGFYYKAVRTAQENPTAPLEHLGYWSDFSRPSAMAAASMKYTLPLVAPDGTVYGVIGIGLTEDTVLSNLPDSDFQDEAACYVLGHDNSDENFVIAAHSGAAFSRLLGTSDHLQVGAMLTDTICDFAQVTDFQLAGNVQYLELYDGGSPYAAERWALIVVAERASVLQPLNLLVRMLLLSAIVALAVGILVAVLTCREIVRPISGAIRIMNAKRKYSQVIQFPASNISEIDRMTDAITQLQINVRDFSSQVSKMIRIADVGLGTFMYDRQDDSVFVGQSLIKLLQVPQLREEDLVMSRQEFLSSISIEKLREAIAVSLNMTSDENQPDYTRIYSIAQADGTTRWVRYSLIFSPNTGIGVLQDITDTMMEKKRIEYERDYDSFTGLLNRHAYYNRIEELFHDKDRLKTAAFVMIDLDNLKYVNDTYGHDFGDDYIKTAATILKKFQNYGGIVSRISGDEFNICLPGFTSKADARRIIDDIRAQLLQSSCLLADGTHFKIRASMGVSWYPDDADSYELLMKYADFAMYSIKHSTKGGMAEFDISSYKMDSVLLTGVEEMNRIIEECSVKYAFQSIISARTGEIYGYEALMRVQSKIFQSPVELLRTAKTGAKLYEIEQLTWKKSMMDFKALINAGAVDPSCHLFINSIANCLLSAEDTEELERTYPDLLSQVVLEMLEGESSNEAYNAHKLACIDRWHAQTALDDFGTGYNSEYALITFHPNIIKIDRSIISGCDKDVSRRMIITNLVKLARTKNIRVLAEGVETEEEMKSVIACGVDLMQGYYFSRPLFEPQPIAPDVVAQIQHLAAQKRKQP